VSQGVAFTLRHFPGPKLGRRRARRLQRPRQTLRARSVGGRIASTRSPQSDDGDPCITGDCESVDSTPMHARATSGANGHCARRVAAAMITLVASLSLVPPALAAPRYNRCPSFLWSGGAFSASYSNVTASGISCISVRQLVLRHGENVPGWRCTERLGRPRHLLCTKKRARFSYDVDSSGP
jgi:hypothetical protein